MNTRIGFVGTYPPTLCGIATFTASLYRQLTAFDDVSGHVIRLVDSPAPACAPEVRADLVADDLATTLRCAAELNAGDLAIIQHEYGIYGGPDGDQILPLLEALVVPSIVVLHTVLTTPTARQRMILERLVASADAVVTMTTTARDRLAAGYDVDLRKVRVIPHGASALAVGHTPHRDTQRTILTWGLIGPGKGIEWAIEAMGLLRDLEPAAHYVVAGQTHPKVLARDGEQYRAGLQRQVRDLGLTGTVTLDGLYRHAQALAELVASADVVLLPYDSTEQVTSGVLIEAVAALKPVVATGFPHAVELLTDGPGILVPHRDPQAIAAALRALLTQRDLTAGMSRSAAATSPALLWSAVARRYLDLGRHLMAARVPA